MREELQFFTTSQDRINDLRWYSLMWEGHRDENRNRLSQRAVTQGGGGGLDSFDVTSAVNMLQAIVGELLFACI